MGQFEANTKGLYSKMMTGVRPEEAAAKSVEVTRKKAAKENLKDLEMAQTKLRNGIEAGDKTVVRNLLVELDELFSKGKVKYADVQRLKIGKDVGNAMKMDA